MIRKTPLRRVSKKRAKQMKTYSALRNALLERYPVCMVAGCEAQATECHHLKGRGKHYLDASLFFAACNYHHRQIHDRPSWARSMGYLLR